MSVLAFLVAIHGLDGHFPVRAAGPLTKTRE